MHQVPHPRPGLDIRVLSAELARLAREMAADDSVSSVAGMIVDAAVREAPGADFAGITIIDRSGARTPAATDELVARIDATQYHSRQGPCLEAADRARIVRSDDLSLDSRWPAFAAAAVHEGIMSIMAFPLFAEAGTVGALNLYSRARRALGPDAERTGFLLAAHAGAAVVTTRASANLRTALDSRDLIGQAKGILMERHKISGEQAFTLLVTVSQRTNAKLNEIARHLTDTGELMERRRRSR